MKLKLDVHGEKGFEAKFPYSPQNVADIKRCLGFQWDKKGKKWYSEGPEVLLDLERNKMEFEASPAAKARADELYQQLTDVWWAKDPTKAELDDEKYAFQCSGTQVLVLQKYGILADEMGLGKSKQALDACAEMHCKDILILAPKSLLWNWQEEVRKWYPDWVIDVLPDKKEERGHFWQFRFPCAVVANYEKLLLQDWPEFNWDALILDEITRAKNTRTQTHKQLRRLVSSAKNVFALTGTPLEMRIEELYGITSLVRPSVFGNYSRFRDQHLVTDFFGNVVGSKGHQLLKERIGPWMTRRTKAEVASQLPPKVYNTHWIELSAGERQGYEEIRRDYVRWLQENERDLREANALTQLLRLQQFTSSPELIDSGSVGSKFCELEEIIGEWPGRVVVFTRFADMARRLSLWLNLPAGAIIHGGVPADDRLPRIDSFNNGNLGNVLVSTDAGAYGLNITGADLVIHYDMLWNPAKLWQREDRLHRIGQERTVNVLKLITKDTVDEGMLRVLEKREELFHDIVDGAEEAALLRLSPRQLRLVAEGKL